MLKRFLLGICATLMLSSFGASQAFGSFVIALSLDGGVTKTQVASGGDFGTIFAPGITFGDFTIDLTSATSSNASPLSKLLTSNLNIMHTGGSASDVLSIFVTQTNFSLPAGPFIVMRSSAGGSYPDSAPLMTGIFEAFFDASNALYGTANSNGLQNGVIAPSGGSFDTGNAFGTYARSGDFSVTSQINIVLDVGQGTNINSSIALTAVPVPAGLVLVATAAPLIGFGWMRRRRLANA